ncbi:MAG: hypothetical protein HY302_09580 [Opitutae bacterium]|nr:hypothetical protein [Opitutae bacterium]
MPTAFQPPAVSLTGPAALRALAQAFTHLGDFDRFVKGLQAALDKSALFAQMTIRLDRAVAEAGPHYSSGSLTLPIAGDGRRVGALKVTPGGEHRQFGAEDLHLMAGLADFLSVTLTQALHVQDAEKSRELLRFLLNQAPVGIAAYSADRRLLVANDLATRWLGESGVPFEEFSGGAGGFHLRASGKLLYGEARRASAAADAAWIVVLQDLSPEQVRLLDQIQRETYRALAEKRRLGFALIESGQLRDGVLRRLPEVRAALVLGEVAGPYDGHRLGLIISGAGGLALRARLRKLRQLFSGIPDLRLGYAELGRDGRAPEQLIQAALERHGDFADMVRPAVLVHDDNPAVADTLAMVLGRDFRVVKSSQPDRTRELLGKESFEGFVTELDSRHGPSGSELVRYAREQQPEIHPFFTTVQQAPYDFPSDMMPGEAVMLEKPFDVAALTQLVKAKLGG